MSARTLTILKRVLPAVLVVAVVCVGIALLLWDGYEAPPMAYEGSSEDLKETVIVPTLDTPMPKGKNVIWCASFQLAWNEFRDDVIGEPLQITGAQEIADRLNASPITADVLDPDSHYAAAGYVKDGVVEQIGKEMAARFPDVPTTEFDVDDPDLVAVMYAYLTANVKFTHAFYEQADELMFGEVPVTSFGISESNRGAPARLREQIEVLYYSGDPYGPPSPDDEFAIDPCTLTEPYQIILARIEPKASLAETLADLNATLVEPTSSSFLKGEVLLIPNMHWKVLHHFGELEGAEKLLQNEGHTDHWLEELQQRIELRLDKSGAELQSESRGFMMKSAGGGRRFVFDRPFLIVMKKRDTERPFFVMWVENAELLCKP